MEEPISTTNEAYRHLNPFATVSLEKSYNYSLLKKWQHTFLVLSGNIRFFEQKIDENDYAKTLTQGIKYPKFRVGLLDYIPPFILTKFLIRTVQWLWVEKKNQEGANQFFSRLLAILLGVLVILPLAVLQLLLSLVFTLVSAPVVALVHVFIGPGYRNGKTPLRQLLFFNPFTWAMGAYLTALLGYVLLCLVGDPQLIASFALLHAIFVAMTMMTLAYCLGRFIYEKCTSSKAADEEVTKESPAQSLHTSVSNYLSEFNQWIHENSGFAVFFGLLFLAILATSIAFTVLFFNGNAPDFVVTLFDRIGCGFIEGLHAMAKLSGLEFIDSLSETGFALLGQIMSSATIMSLAFLGLGAYLPIATRLESVKNLSWEESIADVAKRRERNIEGSMQFSGIFVNGDKEASQKEKLPVFVATDQIKLKSMDL